MVTLRELTLRFGEDRAPVGVSIDRGAGAIYVTLRSGDVARTLEHTPGRVMVDVDASGRILGVELLGPADAGILKAVGARYASDDVDRNVLARVDPFIAIAT